MLCKACKLSLLSTLRPVGAHILDRTPVPLLYHIRTIQRAPSRRQRRHFSLQPSGNSVPFEGEKKFEDLRGSQREAQDDVFHTTDDVSDEELEPRQRIQTMTETEHKAFRRLFDGLRKDSKDAPSLEGDQSISNDLLSPEELAEMDPYLDQDTDLLVGMQGGTTDNGASRYPVALRDMAARAQARYTRQTWQAHRQNKAKREAKTKGSDRVLAAQRDAFRSVEQALQTAKTDLDVWNVLRKQLFPSLQRFEESRSQEELDATSAKTSGKKSSKGKSKKSKQALPMGAQSYHILFLLALRLLCQRTTYTPFATALLPMIKSHSRTSSMLGTSVAIYNEALAYSLRVSNDLASLLSMLEEMRNLGLPMNLATLNIVDEAIRSGREAQEGHFGLGLQAVESMLGRCSEYEELQRWRETIRTSLEEEALLRSRRAEAYEQMRAEGTIVEEDEPGENVASDKTRERRAAAAA